MVARPGPRKSSCNAGELMDDLKGRPDIKQYYSGGLRFKHIEPIPQSGFRLMAGSDHIAPVRAGMSAVNASVDSTSLGPHSGVATIWQIAFDNWRIEGVEINGLVSDTGAFAFWVDLWVEGQWVQVGATMTGGPAAVSRFVAFPPGDALIATYARLRVSPSQSMTFSLTSMAAFQGNQPVTAPRYLTLPVDRDTGYQLAVGNGFADIWKKTDWVACVRLPTVTAAMLPRLGWYGEVYTVGLFHQDLASLRIRRAGSDAEWTVDGWPYSGVPDHDYGGNYTKTSDEWDVFIRWSEVDASTPMIALQVTVDGEPTPALFLESAPDTPVAAGSADAGDWQDLADRLATAINDLPSMPGGVSAAAVAAPGDAYRIVFTFGGASAGANYGFSVLVVNTSDASALPSNTQLGETAGEPLISVARGWPSDMALAQDRAVYLGLKSEKSGLLMSQAAEYFTVNTKASGATAARFDRVRGGSTSMEILHVKEARYVLVFSNIGVWFINNRVISRDEPPNFVLTSEVGIAPGTEAVELEGLVYYVSEEQEDGNNEFPGQVYSLNYDDVTTRFAPNPESLLSAHLVTSIRRTARQTSQGERDTARKWLMRADGRLICAKMIRNQDILGFCEWLPVDGQVREIGTDHFNRLWMAIERDGVLHHERMNPNTWFRQTVSAATDLAGQVTGLPYPDGAVVWALADGYVEGPLTVSGGAVTLPAPADSVTLGYWTPPVYESMPHVYVSRNEEILRRPGRIHAVMADVMDTSSIAIGANGEPAENVPLARTSDAPDTPVPKKTGQVDRYGLLGVVMDPTVVITQTRPGALHVRSYQVMEAL